MRPLASAAVAAATAVVLVLGLAACTPSEPRDKPVAEPSASPPPVAPEPSGDGVLRIATLLPTADDLAGTAPAQIAAVDTAVRDLNAMQGVRGAPVEVVHRSAGGAEGERLDQGMADLIARGVDVVIGPANAALLDRMLSLAEDAGIVLLAPAFDGGEATGGTEASEELLARLRQSDPAVQVTASAPETYDAVVLAALAVVLAADDGGASIAFALPAALADGIPCASYGACLAVLETEPAILYTGQSQGLQATGSERMLGAAIGLTAS